MTDKIEEPTLVAGPYIGEFGWEVISWQPMVRNLFMTNPFKRCVVYTGPGRSLLYPWAEVRTLADVPDHQPECLGWHEMEKYMDDINDIINRMGEEVDKEFAKFQLFGYPNLKKLNDPFYMRGRPDLLRGDSGSSQWGQSEVPTKEIVLCVRDRPMSEYRNWEPDNWIDLANALSQQHHVTIIGQTQEDWGNVFYDDVDDQLNKTTIDDCINLFQNAALAVGGCTGTIHLASRCGCDHLVWGGPKVIRRVAAVNWFGAEHKVYNWGWDPSSGMVGTAVNQWLEKGEWM